jgi:adenosylmethionine-8-amino-7-oxononanoate aminotransferase
MYNPIAPMTDSRPTWLSLGAPHVWRPYTQMKTALPAIPVVGADGVRLRLADGRELLDGVGSWWTAVHGYNHPHIREAVRHQLDVLPHVMLGGIAHEQAYTLARRLTEKLPGDLDCVFFSDSGSVAVEVAMKMAMQYFLNRGVVGRTRFVAFSGAYHGDTIGTMAVGDPNDGMHALFGGVLAHQHVVPLPRTDEEFAHFDAFLAREALQIAAVLIEPLIQGAGGMRVHSPERLARVVETARRHGVLVVFDEIFVGRLSGHRMRRQGAHRRDAPARGDRRHSPRLRRLPRRLRLEGSHARADVHG